MTGWVPLFRHLLHHDPDAAAQAEGIRAWLGEAWVHQVSVTFHTTGALLVAGGLAAVLLMRTLHATEGPLAWTPHNRGWIRTAIFSGWGLNFLGGLMRLFQPDHPGLSSFGEVAWVQVLVVKHLALLAAIGFSLLAVELGPERWTLRMRQHATIALVLVLFGSVAGGVSSGLPLPGYTMEDEMDPGAAPQGETRVVWQNATLSLTAASPVTPRASALPVQVSELASDIHITLEWENAQSVIEGALEDPDGETRATTGGTAAPTQAELGVDKNVHPGEWVLRVRSEQAVDERVQVVVRITEGSEVVRVLEETVTPGPRGFEVNLWMDEGDHFNYTWRVGPGDAAIAWDIHSHPEGEVEIHHEGRDRSAEGTFVAGPHEVYSIYWRPDAGETVTLTYRLEGNFTVHSIFRG